MSVNKTHTDIELSKERLKIDDIDNRILELFKKRFECVGKIKEIKKTLNLQITNLRREKEIYDKIYNNYMSEYIYFKPIYEQIITESKNYQK